MKRLVAFTFALLPAASASATFSLPVTGKQSPPKRPDLSRIARAMLHSTDRATRLHLEDSRERIAKTLDPKFAAPASATTTLSPFSRGADVLRFC